MSSKPIRVDPDAPIANGRPFDVAAFAPGWLTAELIYSGLLFATEFQVAGGRYAGQVIARDWRTAQQLADARGLGETVVGQVERLCDAGLSSRGKG